MDFKLRISIGGDVAGGIPGCLPQTVGIDCPIGGNGVNRLLHSILPPKILYLPHRNRQPTPRPNHIMPRGFWWNVSILGYRQGPARHRCRTRTTRHPQPPRGRKGARAGRVAVRWRRGRWLQTHPADRRVGDGGAGGGGGR